MEDPGHPGLVPLLFYYTVFFAAAEEPFPVKGQIFSKKFSKKSRRSPGERGKEGERRGNISVFCAVPYRMGNMVMIQPTETMQQIMANSQDILNIEA